MRIRSQADLDLKLAIISGARRREPSLDFRTAQAAGFEGLDDLTVLSLAADDGRILVSHDFSTMPHHFAQFTVARRSPGLFLIRQDLPVRAAIDSLLLIRGASEAPEWENRLAYLPL